MSAWRKGLCDNLERVRAIAKPLKPLRVSSRATKSDRQNEGLLTVMSANLWHDWPFRRRLPHRLEAFAQLVEKERADIVLLQEVLRSPQIQVDDWLGKRLGMAFVYSRVNGDEQAIGFEEGLAVMSRYPIAAPQLKNLDGGAGLCRRMALAVEILSPLGNVWAVSVHLGIFRKRNHSQWRALSRWVAELGNDLSALIGGDFNAHENSMPIRQAQGMWIDTYRSVNPEGDGTTHGLRLPWGDTLRRRLDYIFLRQGAHQWRVADSSHILPAHEPHSDHCAVLTRCSPLKAAVAVG